MGDVAEPEKLQGSPDQDEEYQVNEEAEGALGEGGERKAFEVVFAGGLLGAVELLCHGLFLGGGELEAVSTNVPSDGRVEKAFRLRGSSLMDAG